MLQIREMQAFDLGAVMAQERAAYLIPWGESSMSSCLVGNYRCEVGFDGGQMVAHMISQLILDELHLLNLCISSSRQREGIGLSLLQHLLDSGRRLKAAQVFLEVRSGNAPALALYRGMGFESIGERRGYYRDKGGREDAIVMATSL